MKQAELEAAEAKAAAIKAAESAKQSAEDSFNSVVLEAKTKLDALKARAAQINQEY